MPVYAQTWRPRPGEIQEIEHDLIRAIRRDTKDDNFFLWRCGGQWVVSYRMGDGTVFEAMFCGHGEQPTATRGMIDSLKKMLQVGINSEEARRENQEYHRARESQQRSTQEGWQEQWEDRKAEFAMHARGAVSGHPMFKDKRTSRSIIVP